MAGRKGEAHGGQRDRERWTSQNSGELWCHIRGLFAPWGGQRGEIRCSAGPVRPQHSPHSPVSQTGDCPEHRSLSNERRSGMARVSERASHEARPSCRTGLYGTFPIWPSGVERDGRGIQGDGDGCKTAPHPLLDATAQFELSRAFMQVVGSKRIWGPVTAVPCFSGARLTGRAAIGFPPGDLFPRALLDLAGGPARHGEGLPRWVAGLPEGLPRRVEQWLLRRGQALGQPPLSWMRSMKERHGIRAGKREMTENEIVALDETLTDLCAAIARIDAMARKLAVAIGPVVPPHAPRDETAFPRSA